MIFSLKKLVIECQNNSNVCIMTFKEMLLALLLSKNSKSNKVNNLLPNKDLRGSIPVPGWGLPPPLAWLLPPVPPVKRC